MKRYLPYTLEKSNISKNCLSSYEMVKNPTYKAALNLLDKKEEVDEFDNEI
jgi:hypothetical protein